MAYCILILYCYVYRVVMGIEQKNLTEELPQMPSTEIQQIINKTYVSLPDAKEYSFLLQEVQDSLNLENSISCGQF